MNRALKHSLIIATIIIADQITKILALGALKGSAITILPFFNLVLVWNRGISFGLLQQNSDLGPLLLVGLSLIITICIFVWLFRTNNKALEIAQCAVIAGALGNVIDRLRFGAVVDFLDFHAFGWHWPAFNIADSAIVLGIAFILIDGLFFEPKREQQKNKQDDNE